MERGEDEALPQRGTGLPQAGPGTYPVDGDFADDELDQGHREADQGTRETTTSSGDDPESSAPLDAPDGMDASSRPYQRSSLGTLAARRGAKSDGLKLSESVSANMETLAYFEQTAITTTHPPLECCSGSGAAQDDMAADGGADATHVSMALARQG